MEYLDIENRNGVAVMTWHADEQNRLTTPFMEEILAALSSLEGDSAVRAVVVTSGAEKFWTSGLHLQWMMEQGASNPGFLKPFMQALNKLQIKAVSYGKPLVAAINGHLAGEGVMLAACMDYRLMVESRGFVRLPEVQINIPFWPGMMAMLKDVIPPAALRDMVYTGDKYASVQAREMGFIDETLAEDALLDRAVELASRLGQGIQETYAAIKREMRRHVIWMMENEDPKVIEQLAAESANN